MSVDVGVAPARKAKNFPLYQTLTRFVRDPLREIQRISNAADGQVARLDLGASRPFIVTHPDHVQQVLRTESEIFVRDGTFWRPLHGLFGDSIMSEYAEWEVSKRILQPVLSTKTIRSLSEHMASTIDQAVGELAGPAREGRPIEVLPEMGRIVNDTVTRVLFGDKIRQAEADRLIPAMEQLATSIAFRFLLPFVPKQIPLPGDRAFAEGLRAMDETLFELVDRFRYDAGEGYDIFTALCKARMTEGSGLDDTWIRDNLLAMWATSTETTTVALTWIWPLLAGRPDVAGRLADEVRAVVAPGEAVRPEHLSELPYVRQVVQELLRLYPVGWIFPRITLKETEIGGVRVKAGQTVLISPFLTQRLESVWEGAAEFRPERFAPDKARTYHRYAYFPFGGGPHQCIGRHVFNMEAELILASVISRFTPEVQPTEVPVEPRIGATLRPNQPIHMLLHPVEGR